MNDIFNFLNNPNDDDLIKNLNSSIPNNSSLNAISTNKSFRDISNDIGLTTPFGRQSVFYKSEDLTESQNFFQTGFSLLNKLVDKFNSGVFILKDYEILTSPYTKVNVGGKVLESYLLGKSNKKPKGLILPYDVVKSGKPNYKVNDKGYYFNTLISTQKHKTISKPKAIYSYTLPLKDEIFKYRVLFPFNSFKTEDSVADKYGIIIESHDYDELEVLLSNMSLTYNTNVKTKIKNDFDSFFTVAKKNRDKLDKIYEFAPQFVIEATGNQQLLEDLVNILIGFVDDYGTNEEIGVLKILAAIETNIKSRKNNSQKSIQKLNTDFLDFLIRKKEAIFIGNPIRPQKIVKATLLRAILHKLDGIYYNAFIKFIWNIWKNSNYANVYDITENTLIDTVNLEQSNNKTGPVILDYRSNKALGFHTDNATIKRVDNSYIKVDITIGTGVYENKTAISANGPNVTTISFPQEIKVMHTYRYHLFSPIILVDTDNPTFIFNDEDEQNKSGTTKIPAFMLLEREKQAFWENAITAGEYLIDIATTTSGVLNILKAGRLYKIIKAGHTLVGKTKTATDAITAVKAFTGIVEVTSGVGNGLIKLVGKKDSKLGRAISKYLFYLELLSLTGELSVALHGVLRKSATDIIDNHAESLKDARKNAKNTEEAKQIDEVIEHLEEVAEKTTIRTNLISKVPGIKEFNKWFDDLTYKEFDILWKDLVLRRKVERRLRYPGGYHEWLMVSRANVFKKWGVKANEIRTLRTKISDVIFKNPPGRHGGKGSTKAHNEILKLIDESNNYQEFVENLVNWSNKRLEGGSKKLPKGFFN